MVRLLLPCLLFLSGVLGATGGPARPLPAATRLALDSLLGDLAPVDEAAAMAAYFAPPPALFDGDDIRTLGKPIGEAKAAVDSARSILQMVLDPARQITSLLNADPANLPLGLTIPVGNSRVTIALGRAKLMSTHATVDVFLGIDLPSTDQDPVFAAKNVSWTRRGGLMSRLELSLISDWGIDLQSGKSRLILHAAGVNGSGCKAVIDCGDDDVFKYANIDATVVLSRDWVVPVVNGQPLSGDSHNAERNVTSSARVHAGFTFTYDADHGFFASTEINQPFVFKGKEKVQIQVSTVALDLSSGKNQPGMKFPVGYRHQFVNGDQPIPDPGNGQPPPPPPTDNRWEGLYIEGVRITIPEQFRRNSDADLAVAAPQIIIDDTGITAHIYATGLLTLGEKKADQWAFSVDSVDVKLMHSTFQRAQIVGLINIPLLTNLEETCGAGNPDPQAAIDPADCIDYNLIIRSNGFYAGIRLNRDYCIPAFKAADVTIRGNSMLELELVEDEFTATATLHGGIDVDTDVASGHVTVTGLGFHNLVLRTRGTFFSPGQWDPPTLAEADFETFRIGLRHIKMAEDSINSNGGRNCQLYLQAYLETEGDFNLDATGNFRILGRLVDTDDGQKWRYRALKIDAFSIHASTSSFAFSAAVAFYGQDNPDPDWGKGFYGSGSLVLKAVTGAQGFAAVAQFGKKDGRGYFLIDVMAVVSGMNIQVAPGLKLGAVGGGVYKNMTANDAFLDMQTDQSGVAESRKSTVAEAESYVYEVDYGGDEANRPVNPLNAILGNSLSGKQYFVSDGGFGLFIQLVLVAPSEEAYSITGILEMEVNNRQGWSASITASAQAMNPPNYTGQLRIEEGVGVFVRLEVLKNEDELSFEASAELFINVAGGRVTGMKLDTAAYPGADPQRPRFVSEEGFAGGVYLKFSNQEWYFYAGRPDGPIGVTVLQSIRAWAYFCVGSNVPPMPPLPHYVTAIAGQMDTERDNSQFQNAAGFAFGAGITLGTGDRQFAIFTYSLNAGVGFDINIRKYGDAVCADDAPNGPAIGVDGWYAMGQAWAYASGSIGIRVRLFLVNINVNILEAAVAAVLQLRGPNPTSAQGRIAGRYSVLNGLVRGRFRVDAKFGENCDIVGRTAEDPFASIDLINGSNPFQGQEDVNPNVELSLATTLPIREAVEINSARYELRAVTQRLTVVATEEVVAEYSSGQQGEYGLNLPLYSYLEPHTEYAYYGQVSLWKKAANGDGTYNGVSWEQDFVVQDTVIYFTTGAATDTLEPGNISAAYPFDGMVNVYRDEYDRGQVTLHRAQPDLMQELTAVWTREGSTASYTTPVDVNNRTLRFDFPTTIAADKVYRLELVQHFSANPGGGGDHSAPQGPGSLDGHGPGLSRLARAVVAANAEEARTVYRAYFRTSEYATIEDKLTAMVQDITRTGGSGDFPGRRYTNQEGFSGGELSYAPYLDGPMLRGELRRSTVNWPGGNIVETLFPVGDYNVVQVAGSYTLGQSQGTNGAISLSYDEPIDVYFPAENAYFYAAGAENIPPAVREADFMDGGYRATVAEQYFDFEYPALVDDMMQRLVASPVPQEEMLGHILELLQTMDLPPSYNTTRPWQITQHSVGHCLTSFDPVQAVQNWGGGGGPPGGSGNIADDTILQIMLKGSWATEADGDTKLGNCSLPRPVRLALRYSDTFDSGYGGRPMVVTFKYQAPGMSVRTIPITVTIP